jgi:hypothetical protein
MDNPAVKLLLGSDIGILSIITVGVALLVLVGLGVMFYTKSGKK